MKVVAVVLTDKEAKIVENTLAAAAPHMSPANKRDLTTIFKKFEKAPRQMVS